MYVASRYRKVNHVGGVRKRLAKAITQAFADQGITVYCDPKYLWPALGRWRTDHRCDVMRWEGSIREWRHGKWTVANIQSWEPMTKCLKGFTIYQDGMSYEVSAVDEGCSITERYVCEMEASQFHAIGSPPSGNPFELDR